MIDVLEAVRAGDTSFAEAFETWRRGRKEYAALLRAIKKAMPKKAKAGKKLEGARIPSELHPLASAAGVDKDELRTLCELASRAAHVAKDAKELPAAEQAMKELDASITEAQKAAKEATTTHEYNAHRRELRRLAEQRRELHHERYAPAKVAADCVARAKEAGLA